MGIMMPPTSKPTAAALLVAATLGGSVVLIADRVPMAEQEDARAAWFPAEGAPAFPLFDSTPARMLRLLAAASLCWVARPYADLMDQPVWEVSSDTVNRVYRKLSPSSFGRSLPNLGFASWSRSFTSCASK